MIDAILHFFFQIKKSEAISGRGSGVMILMISACVECMFTCLSVYAVISEVGGDHFQTKSYIPGYLIII